MALDTASRDEARAWVARFRPYTSYFKVGMELFTAVGPDFVRELCDGGSRVFLDLKFHDIPRTVARAVGAATHLGVSMLTLHAAGGEAMLAAARQARDQADGEGAPLLLAVTVLTSEAGAGDTEARVRERALLAERAGCDGAVLSPHEARAVRAACGPNFILVTPGVRLPGQALGDQRRVATPQEAFAAGANFIVMGRGIIEAEDPDTAISEICKP